MSTVATRPLSTTTQEELTTEATTRTTTEAVSSRKPRRPRWNRAVASGLRQATDTLALADLLLGVKHSVDAMSGGGETSR